jgi:hypothetical protein
VDRDDVAGSDNIRTVGRYRGELEFRVQPLLKGRRVSRLRS